MAQMLVLYPHPADARRFDRYYFDTHAKLALKIPRLKKLEVSKGVIASPQGECPYHLIARLDFGSMADLRHAVSSPESTAAVADLANFAPDTLRSFAFDTIVVG